MLITLIRDTFGETTLGKLYLDGQYLCETLEDKLRPYGEKIDGNTCIPCGRYNVELSFSPEFGRVMPIIFNQPDGITLIAEGVKFTGIRFHGGNTNKDTKGCPLVAYNRINESTIQGSAEKEVTAAIQNALNSGKPVVLEIANLKQMSS